MPALKRGQIAGLRDDERNLTPPYVPSRTLAKFHSSNHFVRCIMGPYGSGKSVGCSVELLARAREQAPNKNGVRPSRWAVIRPTYPELMSTTIPTFEQWVPHRYWTRKNTAPIWGELVMPLDDGTTVHAVVWFLAMAKEQDAKKALSMELTGAWINEVRELQRGLFQKILGRVGRYPGHVEGVKPTFNGLWCDTNPPSRGHWYHHQAEVDTPDNFKFFRQPGALMYDAKGRLVPNPEAENVQHQSKGYAYWQDMAQGMTREEIKVHVLGEYGSVFNGRPVYDGIFSEMLHVSDEPLSVLKGLPILLGWDFGQTLQPAVVFAQLSPTGQLRVLREVYSGHSMPLRQFVESMVKPILSQEYIGMPPVSWGDPAGNQMSALDGQTYYQELERMGIEARPAVTNKFDKRRQAVATYMTQMSGVASGYGKKPQVEPKFIVDGTKCLLLVEGLGGGYHFPPVPATVSGGENLYMPTPVKNKFSHLQDALQYVALGAQRVQEFGEGGILHFDAWGGSRGYDMEESGAASRTAWAGCT